jgi:ATP-dependent exoDNAse (exonuclease V) alpha subunit
MITNVGIQLVTVQKLSEYKGLQEEILIPRITFTSNLPSGYTLQRQQFPLALSYATTFNSCQGMTLERAGFDLTRHVFSHGQLYMALSRIRG